MIIHNNLDVYFENLLSDVKCQNDTKIYLKNMFNQYRHTYYDLSKDNLVTLFADAKFNRNFSKLQSIGEWLLLNTTIIQKYNNSPQEKFYDNIARLSYYSCYLIINRQIKLFEELAENFVIYKQQINNKLFNI